MLDYIKQRIAEQQASVPSFDDHEDVENQMIVECAAIFQELDDLSVEGADAHRTRSLELDIPIENDIELDTIEFNLTDGRVVDIPMDAVVNQEHFAESMKSYAEFYMEACNVVQPYMREDEYHLEERRVAYAKKHFDVYQEQMIQEGLFGFDKIKLDDPRVPTNVMVDFGPMKEGASQHYVVKLPVFFEIDKKHCVVQAQLDAVTQLQNHNPFEKIAEPLIDALKNKHGIDLGKKTLWDIATPQKLLVPVPKDSYVVMVAFDVDGVSELVYMGWYLARKKSERSYDKHMMYPPEKCESLAKRLDFSNKKEFVKESYVESTPVERPLPSRWDRDEYNSNVYQENVTGRLYVSALTGPFSIFLFDKCVDSGFIKDIDDIEKLLSKNKGNFKSIDIIKLKRLCSMARTDCVTVLQLLNVSPINQMIPPKTKHIASASIHAFEDFRDACGDIIAHITKDNLSANKQYIDNLEKSMDVIRNIISTAKSKKKNDNKPTQEGVVQELTLVELIIALAVVGTIGSIAGKIIFKKNTDQKLATDTINAINKVTKTLTITGDDVKVNDTNKLYRACNILLNVIANTIKNRDKLDTNVIGKYKVLRNACEDVIDFINDNQEDPSNTECIKTFVKAMNDVSECLIDKDATIEKNRDLLPEIQQESYMYQEAIDFGYPDESSEAANKNQPADAGATPPPDPNADNMNQPTVSVDQNATPDVNTTDAPPTENTPGEPVDASATDDKVPVETNDVSDQIAQKISDETTNNDQGNLDADMNLDDINTDMGDPSSTTPDVGDMSSTNSIDNSLNDLDMSSTDSTDVPIGDPSTMDINNMSIDDIMTQAAEKLKSMPIEQVKQFLADGAGGMDTSSTDMGMDDTSMTESYYQQEAFFITKKNVKNELDVALRACLGALNDSEKSLTQIIADFKKNGKKLNRVLGKALKMEKVFNENQMEHLNKLNTALLKLQTGLKPTNSTEETAAVKGLIKAFTDEAVIVGKMLETPTTSETTSEKESE